MTNEKLCSLDERLSCAASFIKRGSVVCDVGTDHAYIPVYLLQQGIARFAIASDVNAGPLERAMRSAEKYGVTDRIHFALADGLEGLPLAVEEVSDIIVCGMGGELIARIIDNSEYTRCATVQLVLQPMSCAPELRGYLCGSGFNIETERLCKAAGKIYACISAKYDGIVREYTQAELILGKCNIQNREPLFAEYADVAARRLAVQIDGMKRGGLSTEAEEQILASVNAQLH